MIPADYFTADFRGCILLLLHSADCEMSLGILRSALSKTSPHNPSMDTLRVELRWLAERGLVTLRRIDKIIDGVIATERGGDAAMGRSQIAGISLPEVDDE